jgi:class 3 adenylate cyclase
MYNTLSAKMQQFEIKRVAAAGGSWNSSGEDTSNSNEDNSFFKVKIHINTHCRNIVSSRYYTGFMTLLTVFVLFADDVRLTYFSISSDEAFFVAFFVSFTIFLLEIILYCIVEKSYFVPYPSFYFWLDLLAAFSIWLDIPWLWNPMDELKAQSLKSDALMAGKASRVGTRAAKIVRILRLLRMIRVAKFLSYEQRSSILHRSVVHDSGDNRNNGSTSPERVRSNQFSPVSDENAEPTNSAEPSIVSQKMTRLTNSRVILIVLVCIFVFPFFDTDFESTDSYKGEVYGLMELHRLPQDRNASGNIPRDFFKARVQHYIRETGHILYLEICPKSCKTLWNPLTINKWLENIQFQEGNVDVLPYNVDTNSQTGWAPSKQVSLSPNNLLKKYRKGIEVVIITVIGCYDNGGIVTVDENGYNEACKSTVYINVKDASVQSAINNSMKTLFVMFLLLGSSIVFVWDAEFMVVEPLERMYTLVRRLAENPLGSLNNISTSYANSTSDEFETVILEKTLTKIGSLLQVGFGHAGANIIAKSMGRGKLKTLEPGKKVTCVFVYAQIDNYTEIMASLGESAIQYINLVASIVHRSVHVYYGAANKNTGSSFLLAWRIGDGDVVQTEVESPKLKETETKTEQSDCKEDQARQNEAETGGGGDLMYSTQLIEKKSKINLAHRSTRLLAVKAQKLKGGGKRSRKISSLELIESALAAILQIRTRLCLANKDGQFVQYVHNPALVAALGGPCSVKVRFGMHIGWAIEGAVGSKHKIDASYLSPNVNLAARLANAAPKYGTDLLLSGPVVDVLSKDARKMCRKIDRVTVKGSTMPVDLYVFDLYDKSPENFLEARYDAKGRQQAIDFSLNNDLINIYLNRPKKFLKEFHNGVEYYLEGVWDAAYECFKAAVSEVSQDGPTVALMNIIEMHNFTKPNGWDGCRKLVTK